MTPAPGKLSVENAPSLIQNSGDNLSPRRGDLMSPRTEERIRELATFDGFVRKPAKLLRDPRLSLADKAVWEAVSLIHFHLGRCAESLEVVAAIATVAKRQAVRSTAKLLESGWLKREKSPRREYPDVLIPCVSPKSVAGSAPTCVRCNVVSPLSKMGVCGWCRKQERADDEVGKFLSEHGPTAYEIVWVKLQSNGSTVGRKAMRLAYERVTNPPERETA